jgi:hypothetical protein
MKDYEKNKIKDPIFFNNIILANTKNKKETRAEKKERIRIRMLTIIESLEKIQKDLAKK